jgi:hypothetical protein
VSEPQKESARYECPACHREIYSRKRKTCEFCDAELPEEMRLSPEQIEAMEKEIAEIQARHEQERERQEEAQKNARGGGVAYVPPIGFV